jgi:hypothetical protein
MHLSQLATDDVGNRFIFAILAASSPYIAATSCHENVAPKANPAVSTHGLAVTFPFNITLNAYIPVHYSKFLKRNS